MKSSVSWPTRIFASRASVAEREKVPLRIRGANMGAFPLGNPETDNRQLDAGHVESLLQSFRGELIGSGHASYESARRVWNGNIDRRPALIARCTSVTDVRRVVEFACRHALRVSVRGGGHSAPGHGTKNGGLVIDMSRMKSIRVDPQRRIVKRKAVFSGRSSIF